MGVYNIQMWIVCGLIWAVGLLAWVMTYILVPIKAKRTGKNVSGIPGVPFVLFLIAGLLSPYKLLALLCFIDFSMFWFITEFIGALISGDLRYDWSKIYVFRMQGIGYEDFGDLQKAKFNEFYKECRKNKEYKKVAREFKYDFERYCRIVAALRTSKFAGCTKDEAYDIKMLLGISDWNCEVNRGMLPDDVRDLAR